MPDEVLHKVKARLYHNYLTAQGDDYIARTDDEKSLSIEEICAALKNRGGYTGNYNELAAAVRMFYQELVYQLCDGFSVNTGYYSIHLKIGGLWKSGERFDPEKHPVGITFRQRLPMREALKRITVEVEGMAAVPAFIVEVTDADTGLVNQTLTPNEDFIVAGRHIKITKDEAGCGLFLVPAAGGPETEIPKYTENTGSKVIARVPAGLAPGKYKVIIRTKFSGGGAPLKEVRVIESPFTLTVGGSAPAP